MNMLERINVSGLEGNSFSGKTTLLAYMVASGFVCSLPETMKYVNDNVNFSTDLKDLDEARYVVDTFFELEKVRYSEALELAEKSRLPILLDRTLLSVLAYEIGVRSYYCEDSKDVYDYANNRLEEKLESDEKGVLPCKIIFLEVENKVTFDHRIGTRGETRTPFLDSFENQQPINNWYKEYLSKKQINHLLLSSNNMNIEPNSKKVIKFIKDK